MKIGIIGFGGIAPYHASCFLAHKAVTLVACSRSAANRQRGLQSGCSEAYRSIAEMYEQGKPDGVVICVSILNTVEVLKECVTYKKPILAEKPVGLSARETRECAQMAHRAGCSVMVALNRRFYSNMLAARQRVRDAGGALGIHVDSTDNMERIRALGKFPEEVIQRWLFANTIHSLDLIRFFCGDIDRITAFKRIDEKSILPDYAASMVMREGALAHYSGYFSSPGRWLIDIYCGGFRIKFEGHEDARLYKEGREMSAIPLDEADIKYKPGFFKQAQHFIGIVNGDMPVEFPVSTLDDAVQTMEMIEQIHNAPAVSCAVPEIRSVR